jgi:protein-S-isoprenylcysteine O-methyltransferase Ste14
MMTCIRKYFFNLSGIDVFFNRKISPAPKLEIGGLHRYTRHPLYFGTLMFSWGFFFIWTYPHHLVANVVMTLYVLMAIGWEEKKLVQEYGSAYTEYAAKVPRLIPWKLKM